MKFINEVVNGGVTIILFGVTNPVCVPKKLFKNSGVEFLDPFALGLVSSIYRWGQGRDITQR